MGSTTDQVETGCDLGSGGHDEEPPEYLCESEASQTE